MVLLLGAAFVALRALLEWAFADSTEVTYAYVMLAYCFVGLGVFLVWDVLKWHAGSEDGSGSGGAGSMRGVASGIMLTLLLFGPSTINSVRLVFALQDPLLTDYAIERPDASTVVLTGALNDQSVADLIGAIGDHARVIRITSPGGLVGPTLKLAHVVKAREVEVIAADHCISACVMLLAASQTPSMVIGTQLTFHRPRSVVDPISLGLPQSRIDHKALMRDYFLETQVPEWAIEKAMAQELWTPSFREILSMDFLTYLYDPESGTRYSVPRGCAHDPDGCI